MSKPYGTHPVIIPIVGAPTCGVVDLNSWTVASDARYDSVRTRAILWWRDGYLLCLRPTATEPAAVGLTPTQFADASLRADFPARALVVDPYDADGNDIRERPSVVSGHTQQAVEAAEASEGLSGGLYDNGTYHVESVVVDTDKVTVSLRHIDVVEMGEHVTIVSTMPDKLAEATIQDRALRGDPNARAKIDPPESATWSAERRAAAWERFDDNLKAEASDVLNFIDRQNDLSTRLMLLGC